MEQNAVAIVAPVELVIREGLKRDLLLLRTRVDQQTQGSDSEMYMYRPSVAWKQRS